MIGTHLHELKHFRLPIRALLPLLRTLLPQNGHVVNVLKGSTGSSKNIFEQIRRISTLLARPSSKISSKLNPNIWDTAKIADGLAFLR